MAEAWEPRGSQAHPAPLFSNDAYLEKVALGSSSTPPPSRTRREYRRDRQASVLLDFRKFVQERTGGHPNFL